MTDNRGRVRERESNNYTNSANAKEDNILLLYKKSEGYFWSPEIIVA